MCMSLAVCKCTTAGGGGRSYLGIGCKQSWGLWELNLSPLDKQSVALAAEPFPQPHPSYEVLIPCKSAPFTPTPRVEGAPCNQVNGLSSLGLRSSLKPRQKLDGGGDGGGHSSVSLNLKQLQRPQS